MPDLTGGGLVHLLNETEAVRACEIIRLLGYDQALYVEQLGITLSFEDGTTAVVPASVAALALPSAIRNEIVASRQNSSRQGAATVPMGRPKLQVIRGGKS